MSSFDRILLEDGDDILLESGAYLRLEIAPDSIASTYTASAEAYGIGIKAPRKRNVPSKGKEPVQMNTTVRSVQLSLAIMLVLGVTTVNAQNNHFERGVIEHLLQVLQCRGQLSSERAFLGKQHGCFILRGNGIF